VKWWVACFCCPPALAELQNVNKLLRTYLLIAQTAIELGVPLYTFNQKHYQVVPYLQTRQPYQKQSPKPVDNTNEAAP